jgi:DNA-binding Xre family transcriptional regulator
MSLSYEPLWMLLKKLHISKMDFAKRIDISNATLAKLGRNEPITLTIIEKICSEFNCNINDIVIHIPEKGNTIPTEYLKIGTIVECPCISLGVSSTRTRIARTARNATSPIYCVILKVQPENLSINSQKYLIAPILLNLDCECIFDIPFKEAEINNDPQNGYIQLSKMGIISSMNINKIVGKIHASTIEAINSNILLDIINVMIKNNIVAPALFTNLGIHIDIQTK